MYLYKLTTNNSSNLGEMISVLSEIFPIEDTRLTAFVCSLLNGHECQIVIPHKISSTSMREMIRVGINFDESYYSSEDVADNSGTDEIRDCLKKLITIATNNGKYDLSSKILTLLKDFEK